MKLKILFFVFLLVCSSCALDKRDIISSNFDFADIQLKHAFVEMDSVYKSTDKLLANPRNIDPNGFLRMVASHDWTSGFFPGNLWLAYQLTGDESLRESAVKFTNYLYPLREYKGTHDIGFMMNCSYGNANRLSPADSVRSALIQTADNLCGRFNPEIGCIRSWNFGKWNFPVIIDNMMNLDLLFYATRLTGDDKYKELALTHARTTMKNHFRDDYSSYHVVSYNNDGTVEKKCTHQGKSDASSWARGQAWGLYGYTSCYRESKDVQFLRQAENIASLIMRRVKTEDAVPLWDYDAPDTPQTPRDASAAAITASALIELSTHSGAQT